MAPCSACFALLNKTRRFLSEVPELKANVDTALAEADLECKLTLRVRHPLEVLLNDVGIERIAAAQTHSIAEFRPACYYGCQILRPQRAMDDDPEIPMAMDNLFAALGAAPVDYPPKTRCCGGMLIATAEDVAVRLCEELIGWARERGANCIVTVCPLCQGNLDILGRRPRPQERLGGTDSRSLLHPAPGTRPRLYAAASGTGARPDPGDGQGPSAGPSSGAVSQHGGLR